MPKKRSEKPIYSCVLNKLTALKYKINFFNYMCF